MSGAPLPARQARSRETRDRIVEAAAAVVAECGVDGATVSEVARRAGTSVGNFYRRFPSKDALLDHLELEFLGARPTFWDEHLRPERWRDREPRELLAFVVAEIVSRHASQRDLLRAIALRARDDYERRVAGMGLDLAGRIRGLLESVWPGSIDHPDPDRAVFLGLEMVAATAGEILLFRRLQDAPSVAELERELTRACSAYLGLA